MPSPRGRTVPTPEIIAAYKCGWLPGFIEITETKESSVAAASFERMTPTVRPLTIRQVLSRGANARPSLQFHRETKPERPALSRGKCHRQAARILPETLVNRDAPTLAWFIFFQ